MKRVLTAVVLIPVVLFLVFLPPWAQWIFTLVTALVACLAAWEFLTLARQTGARPPRIAVLAAIVALFAADYQWPDIFALIGGGLCLALLVYCTFSSPVTRVLADATSSVFCLVYTGFTLLTLPALRQQPNGPSLVVFLLCVVWAGDIAALYAGRLFGRHKLAPAISPGKTWEGAIASILGSLAVAGGLVALADHLLTRWNSAVLSYGDAIWWYWLILAAIVNVAAQAGDLAESALKRSAGVKDSGTLLPGHGGVLDRIDALLLAAPVLWYAQIIHQRF
jgi:phosphatidate cytidylyltransferase